MIKKILFLVTIVLCTRIHSVSAATASFSIQPANATITQSCTTYADILISVQGATSNAADIIVTYPPTAIEILDANLLLPGVQIIPGTAFESFAGNTVNTATGTIKLVGYSTTIPFQGTALFAKIPFRSLLGSGTGDFTITFSGANPYNTLDSNIADSLTSYDLLSSVTNAHYTFAPGSCISDSTAPSIEFLSPANLQNNVAPNAPVIIRLTDAGTGVSLSATTVTINGTPYTSSTPGVSVTGTPADYTLTIIPANPFASNSLSVLSVTSADATGNQSNKNITINAQYSIPSPTPIIQVITVPATTGAPLCPSPTILPTQPPLSDKTPTIVITTSITDISQIRQIQFDITDDNGLVPETFVFSIDGRTYTLQSTPQLISFTGNKTHYLVTVSLDPQQKLSNQQTVAGYVKISDTYGNTRINNLTYAQTIGTTSPNTVQTNEVLKAFTITLASIAGVITFAGIFGVFSISPILFSIVSQKTGKGIPFARAYTQYKGKLTHYRSDIFGNIHGRLQPGTYLFTIQQFGYTQQSSAISVAHATKAKEIVTLRTL